MNRSRPNKDEPYTREFYGNRKLLLADRPWCIECGERPANTADHIVPIRQGGTHDLMNLQPLCRSCHSRKTALLDGGFGNRVKS